MQDCIMYLMWNVTLYIAVHRAIFVYPFFVPIQCRECLHFYLLYAKAMQKWVIAVLRYYFPLKRSCITDLPANV